MAAGTPSRIEAELFSSSARAFRLVDLPVSEHLSAGFGESVLEYMGMAVDHLLGEGAGGLLGVEESLLLREPAVE